MTLQHHQLTRPHIRQDIGGGYGYHINHIFNRTQQTSTVDKQNLFSSAVKSAQPFVDMTLLPTNDHRQRGISESEFEFAAAN